MNNDVSLLSSIFWRKDAAVIVIASFIENAQQNLLSDCLAGLRLLGGFDLLKTFGLVPLYPAQLFLSPWAHGHDDARNMIPYDYDASFWLE